MDRIKSKLSHPPEFEYDNVVSNNEIPKSDSTNNRGSVRKLHFIVYFPPFHAYSLGKLN